MKHLKTYKIFESTLDLASISDTLHDIFDEYNIPFLSDEDQKNMSDDERWSKFWDYSSDKPFGKASQINIMNLSASEHEQVMDKLIRLIPVIKGRTGYDLDIDTMVSDGMDFILYDIIVKVK